MKTIAILYVLIFSAITSYSQRGDLEMYYPENSLFKKLHVKSVVDTIASPAFHHYKKEYDTLGRQTSWFYVEDSVRTNFQYIRHGDTLIKYHYCTTNSIDGDVYKYEWFIYDKIGLISTYLSCQKSYVDNTCECMMENFFYGTKNRLTTKLYYANNRYKQPFSKDLRPVENLIGIIDGYSYEYDGNGNMTVSKQMGGKPDYRRTDSFYYDKTNRLIKIVSKQKRGYLGEFAVIDLCRTETIKYEKNKRTETKWITCPGLSIDEMGMIGLEINEYVYYVNGLQHMWFYKTGDYPKSMLDYSVYDFFR